MEMIFKRKSVRNFIEKEVEKEKIEQILKAAMAAPSAKNEQPWEFYVVENDIKLMKLSEISVGALPIKTSTVAIVACYRNDGNLVECAPLDLGAATQNILLEVENLGLGAVCIGVYPFKDRINKVKEIVELPDYIEPYSIIPIGYYTKEVLSKNKYDEKKVHYIK